MTTKMIYGLLSRLGPPFPENADSMSLGFCAKNFSLRQIRQAYYAGK